MKKMSCRKVFGNDVSTHDKDHDPKYRLYVGWDEEHSGDAHQQPQQRELKDQFPVHGILFDHSDSSVAACSIRGVAMLPVRVHLPFAGLNGSALATGPWAVNDVLENRF